MPHSIPGLAAAFLGGALVAWLNYLLSRRALRADGGAAAVSAVRTLCSVGYLAAIYFLAPFTPWERIWMLLGAALGLTVPMAYFTVRLLRETRRPPRGDEAVDSQQNDNNDNNKEGS